MITIGAVPTIMTKLFGKQPLYVAITSGTCEGFLPTHSRERAKKLAMIEEEHSADARTHKAGFVVMCIGLMGLIVYFGMGCNSLD